MAWKLKRTKSEEDEPKTKGLKPRDEADSQDEFEHKPGAFEPVANEYDAEFGNQDRTVMLLNDDDFLPGLIPSIGGEPEQEGADAESAAKPHEDTDTGEHSDDFLATALTSADDAVSLLQSVRDDGDEENHKDAPGGASDEWDLDAFAPYQPSAPQPESAAPDFAGVVPALPETLPEPSAVEIEPAPVAPSLATPSASGKLVVRLGQFSASYEVTKAEVTIGRPDPRIDVFPDVAIEWDDAVSRNHARVIHRADGDYIEDTGSTNGTKLNDKPLSANKPIQLKDGDRIQLGEKTEITYVL
ncbi:MAG: FHA domain-containing protein [Capsulimonadaceae bacterium]|nr:FHA domain-containing protein [Capsulimonadaceae bacterium]